MPFLKYVNTKFHNKSLVLIDRANQIIKEYMDDGYTLTLRQLYYQFVSRKFIENNDREYKNLGSLINDARLAGLIDWDAIEDRARNLVGPTTWNTEKDFLTDAPLWFKYDLWKTQKTRIEIWVEKDALTGVVDRIANKYRVPYLACRGYLSQSEAWRAGQRFSSYYWDYNQSVKVLHLGDHDPSGIDMTRDNTERLKMFSNGADVELIRLALNMDQVEQYDPPPNPAKLSDKRAEGYIEKFGESSWELDALNPKIIDGIVSTEIEKYIDVKKWNVEKRNEDKTVVRLKGIAKGWKNPSWNKE